LGAAAIDDILGVLLLAVLFDFTSSGEINLIGTMRIFLFMVVFFLLAPALAKAFSYMIRCFESVSRSRGLIPTSVVSFVLFLAWVSQSIGIPELFGGFVAGLALSRKFFIPFGIALRADANFSIHIQKQMKPIIQLFTPIFFVTVGLSLDLSEINWTSQFFWLFSITLTVIAIVSKMGGALLLKEKLAFRIATGMAMAPRGEVGLIFAELGRSSGLFNNEIYAIVVMVIAYTTLLTPFWLSLFYRHFEKQVEG